MSKATSIIGQLQRMSSIICSLQDDNTVCPEQGGIAYQDLIHTQKTSYRDGDEGYRLANNLFNLNNPPFPLYTQQLDNTAVNPYITLKFNNIFGTKDRFTDIDGLQVYGDNILVDHLTKRMYTMEGAAVNYDWDQAIDASFSLLTGGFNNWFLMTRAELESVLDLETDSDTIGGLFTMTNLETTSTTRTGSPTSAWAYNTIANIIGVFSKTNTTISQIFVRIFDESDLNLP